MTLERLNQMHRAQPFQPFRVHLADGRTLDVPHPEYLAHPPNARTFVVMRPDESFDVVDLLLVTSLEVLNGSSRRPRSKR
jgi:hypothetical protein